MISDDNGLALAEIVSASIYWDGRGRLMSGRRQNGAVAGAALLLLALALGGCSISIGDLPLGSTSSDGRTKDGAYLPVNELPPNRDEAAMDPAERARIQKELIAARERQALATPKEASAKDEAQAQAQTAK
jgi:hypothetical protein